MEETEGRTFTFAILSFSSAARSPRPASEESGYGVGNLVTHMRPTPRSVGRRVECEGYKLASSETANMIATEGGRTEGLEGRARAVVEGLEVNILLVTGSYIP